MPGREWNLTSPVTCSLGHDGVSDSVHETVVTIRQASVSYQSSDLRKQIVSGCSPLNMVEQEGDLLSLAWWLRNLTLKSVLVFLRRPLVDGLPQTRVGNAGRCRPARSKIDSVAQSVTGNRGGWVLVALALMRVVTLRPSITSAYPLQCLGSDFHFPGCTCFLLAS